VIITGNALPIENKSITLLKIESVYDELGDAEKRIADYIVGRENDIVHLTVTEVAENTGVSAATVVRTCKKLGYRGFQDFKITVAQEIVNPVKSIFEEAREDDSCFDILNKEIGSITSTLSMTKEVINKDELSRAAELILNARKVIVYGCGNSAAIANDMAHKMVRAGVDGVSYNDAHKQIISAATLTEDDVAIGISHSGSSKDIVEALEVAKESGSKTICITNYGKSPITEVSDIKLFTASEETKYRIIGLSSRIAQLAIIDSIYVYVSLRNKEKAVDSMRRIERALQSKKY
jgi:RpiR family transcriptional regulator, carbohydrate utilization regulator